ncbi:hypothetical protein ACFCZV_17535 [Streptomyces hydrogenans]|uniref:hypothetical protein n=1 Tax=Streptomyces hydrogenans TaxID=1873719 RepID=UPI0035DA3FF5
MPTPGAGPDASPALAGPVPGGFASWGELFREQQRLNAAASDVRQAAEKAGYDGLTGIVAAPENHELRVYWHGEVPAGLRRHLTARADGVPVSVLTAPYSKTELDTEARRLLAAGGVTLISTRQDGKGVDVRWAKGVKPEASAAGGIPAFTDPAASPDGSAEVPLIAAPDPADPATDPATGRKGRVGRCADGASYCREDDTSPYYAGARTRNCTTGWPIRLNNGETAIMTAAHCGQNDSVQYDGGGDVIGTVHHSESFVDTATIGTNAAGRMWDGWWQNSTFTKPVHGLGSSWVGNWICTSGSRSGALCGFQVTQVGASNLASAKSWPNWPYTVASSHDATYGPGNGDSGGPAFDLTEDQARVIAKGTMSHGYDDAVVPCQGQPSSATRRCYWLFAYSEAYTVFNEPLSALFGAQVITG